MGLAEEVIGEAREDARNEFRESWDATLKPWKEKYFESKSNGKIAAELLEMAVENGCQGCEDIPARLYVRKEVGKKLMRFAEDSDDQITGLIDDLPEQDLLCEKCAAKIRKMKMIDRAWSLAHPEPQITKMEGYVKIEGAWILFPLMIGGKQVKIRLLPT